MKKVELDEEDSKFSEDMRIQAETIRAHQQVLSNLRVNKQVLDTDIYGSFRFYNETFFEKKLDRVILEWSSRMTLCAGICYYEVGFIFKSRERIALSDCRRPCCSIEVRQSSTRRCFMR